MRPIASDPKRCSTRFNIPVQIRSNFKSFYADNDFRVRVRDDGRGIDPGALEARSRPGHWGITGMRERAQKIGARFEIWSRHGAGTEIELKIPASVAYKERRFLSRWWPWRSSNQEMQ